MGLFFNYLQRLHCPLQVAGEEYIDFLVTQLPAQFVSLLNTIQGQTSVRLTLHDLVYVVHRFTVAHQQ